MSGLPTMVPLPDDTLALAVFRLEGETVECNYRLVVDAVQPPRRQVASVLRALADHLEREADELEQ